MWGIGELTSDTDLACVTLGKPTASTVPQFSPLENKIMSLTYHCKVRCDPQLKVLRRS